VLRERGHRTANDQYRDLIILDRSGEPQTVFEVKPSTLPYAVYQAVGQLLFHTTDDETISRVAVLPAQASPDIRERLAKLGISIIGFEWEGKRVRFTGLDNIRS
jgi:hypothetical protein